MNQDIDPDAFDAFATSQVIELHYKLETMGAEAVFDSTNITNTVGNTFVLEKPASLPSTLFTISAVYETFLILGTALPEAHWRASNFTCYETRADGKEESVAVGSIARNNGGGTGAGPAVIDMNAQNSA